MSDSRPGHARFERAILRVPRPALLWQRAGGMLGLERHMFTARRAGIKVLWIAAGMPDADVLKNVRFPAGLAVRWAAEQESLGAACAAPYLDVNGDYFLRTDALMDIVRRHESEAISFNDAHGVSVVTTAPTNLRARAARTLPTSSYHRLESPMASATLDWLMAAGPKPQDGFMAKYLDRELSTAISRRLLDTTITPNMMTVTSTILGLIGACFFLGSSRAAYIPGALIIWLHSVLDGCDGELARVRHQESPLGSDLDFWGDNVVHLALFSCLGIGFWRTGNGAHTLALATIADLGVMASAWTAWQHRLRHRADPDAPSAEVGVTDVAMGDDFESRLSRLENALAQRDFIYLLVLLALVDCVYEFLWAAAIGSLLYFGIMLYLRRVNGHEQERNPYPVR